MAFKQLSQLGLYYDRSSILDGSSKDCTVFTSLFVPYILYVEHQKTPKAQNSQQKLYMSRYETSYNFYKIKSKRLMSMCVCVSLGPISHMQDYCSPFPISHLPPISSSSTSDPIRLQWWISPTMSGNCPWPYLMQQISFRYFWWSDGFHKEANSPSLKSLEVEGPVLAGDFSQWLTTKVLFSNKWRKKPKGNRLTKVTWKMAIDRGGGGGKVKPIQIGLTFLAMAYPGCRGKSLH